MILHWKDDVNFGREGGGKNVNNVISECFLRGGSDVHNIFIYLHPINDVCALPILARLLASI